MPPKTGGGSAAFTFSFDKSDLRHNIDQLPAKVDGYIHAAMDFQSTAMLNYARVNAPWTDRTGNARTGLSVRVGWVPMVEHTITLFHRVPYGIWLEIRWSGRFAIVGPTIMAFGPNTMKLLDKLFSRLGGGGGTFNVSPPPKPPKVPKPKNPKKPTKPRKRMGAAGWSIR